MRAYEQSHPWINFDRIDFLQQANYPFWMLLGRAQANVQHIVNAPLSPDIAAIFQQIYLAKGALATTAIEGNTLTEEQAQQQIAGELKLPPSKAYLGSEIDNVVTAYQMINTRVLDENLVDLTPDMLDHFNALVLERLRLDESVSAGKLRQHNVTVGRYRGAPAEDVPYLVEKFCEWVNGEFAVPPGYEIAFGILKAVIAHVYFAWIHPYGDGNGRTARLIEFQILLASGVPETASHLLSNFYNETRSEYYRQLQKTSAEHPRGLLSFVEYALQGFVDSLEGQIGAISEHQVQVQWRDYVYDQFRGQDSLTGSRRRRLALDIMDFYLANGRKEIIPAAVRGISADIAAAYAGKNERTLQRDLIVLSGMGLIRQDRHAIAPNLDMMQGFKPRRRS